MSASQKLFTIDPLARHKERVKLFNTKKQKEIDLINKQLAKEFSGKMQAGFYQIKNIYLSAYIANMNGYGENFCRLAKEKNVSREILPAELEFLQRVAKRYHDQRLRDERTGWASPKLELSIIVKHYLPPVEILMHFSEKTKDLIEDIFINDLLLNTYIHLNGKGLNPKGWAGSVLGSDAKPEGGVFVAGFRPAHL